MRSADCQRDRRLVDIERRAWLPAEHRHRCLASSDPFVAGPSLRPRRSAESSGRLRRYQGTGCHHAAVPPLAHAVEGHRALPGSRLPDVRNGRDPGRLPRCPGAVQGRRRARLRGDQCRRCRAGADVVGQQPVEPHRRVDRSRSRCRMGPGLRRAGLQRRVLCRVHVGCPGQHDPAPRVRRCGRGAFAVEAIQPRRSPSRVLRGRRRPGRLPEGGPQARWHVGAGPGAGRGGGGTCRRRPRRCATRPVPAATRAARQGSFGVGRRRSSVPRWRVLPVVRCRRRMGVCRTIGSRRRRVGQPW